MSEMSKKARADMRAKANRLGNSKSPGKVDSSSWSPGSPLNADRKTGARPVRSRIYKHGGKIQGDRGPVNASRTPRKDGGALNVHDTVGENKSEKGSLHEGGYKKGGRAEKCGGGGMNKGGRAERAAGGPSKAERDYSNQNDGKVSFEERMSPLSAKQRSIAAKVKASTRDDKDLKVLERKSGGRAKGKTNINIIIGNPQDKPQGMLPQVPVRPPVPPMAPPPGPPPGGPPPMAGPPPGPPPGMGPPMGGPGMPPPMMRRSGGRTVPMTAGALSGPGRLEKTANAKRT